MTLVPLGRPRKPTAVRVAEGMRGHRPLPDGEPKPRVGAPDMPDYLPPLAEFCWKKTIEEMSAVAGWLVRADWRILEGYAIDYAIWRDAIAGLKQHGLAQTLVFVDSSGQEHIQRKPQPELKALNDADVRLKKAEAALGLSPVFRARISLQVGSEDEDLDLAP